ncbi:MAG: cytochrome Cyp135B6 2 [Conexibacter sp.]|nr:cytochrome Cyp135B6 2 [Conexibacter sp.]
MQQTWLVVTEPEVVRELFARGPEAVDAGQANFHLRGNVRLRNTFLFDGSEHLDRRRLIAGRMRGRSMIANADHVTEAIDRMAESWPAGRRFAALPSVRRVTSDLMTHLVLGDPDADGNRAVRRALWDHPASDPGQLAVLDRAVFAEIARRRATGTNARAADCMSALLSARTNSGAMLADRDVRDEVISLMLAGAQKTTALLAWAIHELARDPVAQERLRAREPGFADRVITETLRLHPPHLTGRRLREPMSFDGHDLPAGAFLLVTPTTIHRRKDLYDDPKAFRPDRFDVGRKPPVGSWLPYGGGVRRCPGASLAHFEARLSLERIVDRFDVSASRRRRISVTPRTGAR